MLQIEEVPGRLVCHSCDSEYDVDDQVLLCPCGSAEVSIVAGDELSLTSVELTREEASCA